MMKLFYAVLIGFIATSLSIESVVAEDTHTENNSKNSIDVIWSAGSGCREVEIWSSDHPIQSVVFDYVNGTRDYANRFAKEPLGYVVNFTMSHEIKSIHVKIHDDGYDGPGLGPKFKCEDDYDDNCEGNNPPPWCFF